MTKLSLLLKVLEGESAQALGKNLELFRQRVLPDLTHNIQCGNSLIGPDFYQHVQMDMLDEDERYRINVFDWRQGFPDVFKGESPGFDAVIGNPPYDVLEKDRGKASWPHDLLSTYVRQTPGYAPALGGKLNLYRFFVVRSIHLTRVSGRYGMIMPLSLLADISTARTRQYMILRCDDLIADCFPQKDNPNDRVFLRAKLSTAVVTGTVLPGVLREAARIEVRVYPGRSFVTNCRRASIGYPDTALIDPDNLPIPLVDEEQWHLCRRIHSGHSVTRLGDVTDFRVNRGEVNQTIFRAYITDNPSHQRLLKGVEVGRYCLRDKLSQGCREWLDERSYTGDGHASSLARLPRIALQRITGVDERLRVVGTVMEPPAYFADSTNSIVAEEGSHYALEYLLGLLNSALIQWRFKLTSSNNNVGTNELESLPFRRIDFSDTKDKARHDRMVRLVEHMLQLHRDLQAAKSPHDRQAIQRQIDATDHQIDQLVYDLYGLTEQEIRIVEESTGNR